MPKSDRCPADAAGVAGALEQDVRRLHVAVDETLGVRGVERRRDLLDDPTVGAGRGPPLDAG